MWASCRLVRRYDDGKNERVSPKGRTLNNRRRVAWGLCLAGCLICGVAVGQDVRFTRTLSVPAYSPATSISCQIQAESNYLRAYGEAAVDLEVARGYRAQAVSLEIQNSVDYTKAYWERRSVNEAERLKRHVTIAQKHSVRDSHIWNQLKNHPDLSVAAIPNGTALNFLLDRLAGGVLAYQFSAGENEGSLAMLQQLELSPEVMGQLRVRQDLPGGGRTVFRLQDGKPLNVEWWPAALRGANFKTERTQFEQARALLLISETDESVENNLKVVFQTYDQLVEAFHQHHTRAVRLKSVHDHREYGLAKRFLQSIAGELYRIRSVGPKALKDDSLRFGGNNMIALLTHMSRNGLEFAPALPGEEPAYHQVFHMMRDLLVAVAEDGKSGK